MNWKIRKCMKQDELVTFALIAVFFLAGCNAGSPSGSDEIETAFVDSILTTLTVQDKVGEMTQLTAAVGHGKGPNGTFGLSCR